MENSDCQLENHKSIINSIYIFDQRKILDVLGLACISFSLFSFRLMIFYFYEA